VVIATGVTSDGGREVLGLDVGDSEDGAFWTAFLRSLKARGLAGVQLVVSDAHTGLKAAISAVMAGACWQRSSVQTPGRRERPARHLHRRETRVPQFVVTREPELGG
jgi:transposase-like protein